MQVSIVPGLLRDWRFVLPTLHVARARGHAEDHGRTHNASIAHRDGMQLQRIAGVAMTLGSDVTTDKIDGAVRMFVYALGHGDTPCTDVYGQISVVPSSAPSRTFNSVTWPHMRDQEVLGGRALCYVDPWPVTSRSGWWGDLAVDVWRRIMARPHISTFGSGAAR